MKKEEFYFDSRDGVSKIHAVRYTPEDAALNDGRPRAVLQIVHGMAEYIERYEKAAEFFTDRGYVVTGEDHLGHGRTVGEDGVFGYFCPQDPATVIVRDVHRLKKLTQALYPDVPYVILGHSMGSFILRNYITRYGTGIGGAIIEGTGMPPAVATGAGKFLAGAQKFFCGGKHEGRLLAAISFGTYNKRVADLRTPYDWICKERSVVDTYMADPLCGFTFTVNGFQTLFESISRTRKKENLEKIPKELPVYLLSGSEDPVGDYGKGVQRVRQMLADAGLKNLQMKLYEGDRHELLNEADRETVMRDICDWIERNVIEEAL